MRPMDTELKTRMSPPLGLYTIVSLLRDKHRVVVQNENVEEITFDLPDAVGIMLTLDVQPRAVECHLITYRRMGLIGERLAKYL